MNSQEHVAEAQKFEVERVSIKLPPFWTNNPELWFAQMESQFFLCKITEEETKYHHLVSSLEAHFLECMYDIVKSKDKDRYTQAKVRLLKIYGESSENKLKRLVTGLSLGTEKPSQLLLKMRSLADTHVSEQAIRTLWIEKLPESVKNILVICDGDLDKQAEWADRMIVTNPRSEMYATRSTTEPGISDLQDQIKQLQQQVATLSCRGRQQSRNRNHNRSRSSSRNRSRKFNEEGKYCYFHFRFGNKCRPEKCRQPCKWKQQTQNTSSELSEAAMPYTPSNNDRLFVRDRKTGMRFLVDSGADVSIIPASKNSIRNDTYKLYAANDTEIPTYGTKILSLDLGLRREFQWPFIVAKVNRGILGADFLSKFNLIINIKQKKLMDGQTKLSVNGEIQSVSQDAVSFIGKNCKFQDILTLFPDITKPKLTPTGIKHNTKHNILTKGNPVFCRARQLNTERLKLAKQEFQFLLDNEIIRPSKSPWASPLHLASKKDGTLRPCGDYRKLNDVTIPDRYPIPRLEDFQHILHGKQVFSKIDLFKAYYQIPIAEEDKKKTAVITPFGLYEFNVMSFGLRNAPSTFQRFINEVFQGLDFLFPYLDDILIASESLEEHRNHLKLVFDRLNKYGLRINISKSVFGEGQLEFLGHQITPEGSKPLTEKVKAVLEYELPQTVNELRTFLGMINFYRRYLKNAAEVQAPLHEYLKGAKKNDKRKIEWSTEAKRNFEKCKEDLANTAMLTFPKPELPLTLCTDASEISIGAVLQQFEGGSWKPIAFYSKKLSNAQRVYSTYDRELLGIYLSVKQLKHFLEGREFTVRTDHKPLIYAFKQKNEKASPRQQRHLQYISQFTTAIEHIKGSENVVADTLSRIQEIKILDYDKVAVAQEEDGELRDLLIHNNNTKFKKHRLQSGKELWCDTSTNNVRPYIPGQYRKEVFHHMHGLAHPGVKATVKQTVARYIWPGIKNDIRKWTQSCINCQKNKVSRHTKSKVSSFLEPDERFNTVHIDIVGPLPPSDGYSYCVTMIDRFTSWMEVIPTREISAQTVARVFFENWISRFGVPARLITDQGRQFESAVLHSLAEACGIKIQHTTAYHPQANGKIERLHRTMKTALKAHNSIRWTESLPTVLLGLRAAIRQDVGFSIAQMVYGKTMKLPGEFFQESKRKEDPGTLVSELIKQMEQLRSPKAEHHGNKPIFIPKDLKTTPFVFLRIDRLKKQLEPAYEGPYQVLERTEKYFTLLIKGKEVNISIDRLKPAYLLSDEPELPNRNQTGDGNLTEEESPSEQMERPLSTLPERQTRSGRFIRRPSRFSHVRFVI